MTKRTSLISICFMMTLIFIGYKTKRKYYYVEDNKNEELIEAYSDSAAYLEAYKDFVISKKVYNDMQTTVGNTYLSAPVSFQLLNDKHEDITYKIFFTNKDSLESSIEKRINKLPNSIEESITKAREEKNGIGAKYDTGGLCLAPIKVLSAKFVSQDHSSYKNVSL